jgi:3-oxoacyl-[acyl-carrier protein] reductase
MAGRLMKRFENKVAVVTGGAQGIGKQAALDFASEGAAAVIVDVEADLLEETKGEIEAAGWRCMAIRCDVSSREQVDDMVRRSADYFGGVHILVNNAGVLAAATIEETTDQLIERTLDVNLKGTLYAVRAVTPVMKKQKYGRIVNVASITGKAGDNTISFAYGASKGAMITLTRSTARELGPWGITSNAIAPHAVMTKLMSYWDEEKKRTAAEKIPLKRLGTVQDISALILFLASDEASFITGEAVNINGGYYMD